MVLTIPIQIQSIVGILEAATIVKTNNFCSKSQKHKTVTIKITHELDLVGNIRSGSRRTSFIMLEVIVSVLSI